MDLLTKVVVYALVLVVALFALYYAVGIITGNSAPTQEVASENISGYLNMIYPGANITITNIVPSVYAGSWHVVAAVVANATTPCPSYQVYTYDYPKFALVNGTENKYTALNCTIYNYEPGDAVGSAPVAVTLASNLSNIREYVDSFGFANVRTSVAYNETAWQIAYSSPFANYTAHVLLSQRNGNVIGMFNTSR